jgi:hypothetical protein
MGMQAIDKNIWLEVLEMTHRVVLPSGNRTPWIISSTEGQMFWSIACIPIK